MHRANATGWIDHSSPAPNEQQTDGSVKTSSSRSVVNAESDARNPCTAQFIFSFERKLTLPRPNSCATICPQIAQSCKLFARHVGTNDERSGRLTQSSRDETRRENFNGMTRGDTSFQRALYLRADFFWSQSGRSQLTCIPRTTQIATQSELRDVAGIFMPVVL